MKRSKLCVGNRNVHSHCLLNLDTNYAVVWYGTAKRKKFLKLRNMLLRGKG